MQYTPLWVLERGWKSRDYKRYLFLLREFLRCQIPRSVLLIQNGQQNYHKEEATAPTPPRATIIWRSCICGVGNTAARVTGNPKRVKQNICLTSFRVGAKHSWKTRSQPVRHDIEDRVACCDGKYKNEEKKEKVEKKEEEADHKGLWYWERRLTRTRLDTVLLKAINYR